MCQCFWPAAGAPKEADEAHEAAGSREPAVSVVSTYPGLHSGKLLASVATRFDESFAAAKLSPFSDY